MITYDYSLISSNFANWFNSGNGLEDYINNLVLQNESFNSSYTQYTATIAPWGGIGTATLTLNGSFYYYSSIDSLSLSASGIGTINYSNLNMNTYNYTNILYGSRAERIVGSPYADSYYGYGGRDE